MSYSNGKFPDSALASIPSGRLAKEAAAAWNAPGGPADNGLYPTGPNSSYRTYEMQVYYWNLYQSGSGNLAAQPGTSNHGWGLAVDLASPWMRTWIDEHGAKFGWQKVEAPSEWWHVNFVGGVGPFPPPFEVLKKGDRNKRVKHYVRRLKFIHASGHKAYIGRLYLRTSHFGAKVEKAVEAFQRDQGLKADGVIGEHTGKRINFIFDKQFKNRKKSR